MVIAMNKYVFKLCSLGIPACNAYAIVCDFLKNFNVEALEEYIADLERYDKTTWEGVNCVY